MDGLTFNADDHSYRLDGQNVPGVTTALKPISTADYAFVDPEVMERKALFGTAVHKLIELDCLGELDVEDLDEDLVPYYGAWREFLSASGFRVLLSESKLASRRYGYAGQLDLFGQLNGFRAMIDAKCVVTVMPSTGPQTMAYTNLVRESRPDLLPAAAPCQRFALQLRPALHLGDNARWRLVQFKDDASDWRLFLAALTVTKHLQRKIK